MINFLMIFGLLILIFGTIGCLIATIVMAVKKKKKLWVPAIGIPISLVVGFVILAIGGSMYSQTDEYKEIAAKREMEEQEMREAEEQKAESEEKEAVAMEEKEQNQEESDEKLKEGYIQKLKDLFGKDNFCFVESNYLYDNSEYYSKEIVIVILCANDKSGKTLYTHLSNDNDLSIYCRFDNKKEIEKLKEGDLLCVAGIVQENQKTGKVVELGNCHVLAVGKDANEWETFISQNKETQEEFVLAKKSEKIKDIIQMDDKYKENFYSACESCGINVFDTKNYTKLQNWESGERYSFEYGGSTHNVYLLDNGEIESINYCQSTSIKLYENGYESLNIDDFSIDAGTLALLQGAAESVVKQSLNYPSSANFDWWTTGSYSRFYNYYILRAEFSAKNAFGMKDRHSFRIDCTYSEEDGSSLVYYELDGVSQGGEPQIPEIKKNPVR